MFRPLLLLLIPSILAADPVIYCDDPATIADWRERAERYPNDAAIQTLHALWLGLCVKVKEGGMNPEYAIDLFEQERVRKALERVREEADSRSAVGA
jgi:hypothetical protein